MDTAGQWQQFCVCILQGVAGGVLYDICSLPFFKEGKTRLYRAARLMVDLLFCLLFAVLCVYMGNRLGLPSMREYYFLGYAIGLLLYLKTFHKAVAFLKKICYNGTKKAINCLKREKNFPLQKEKGL